MPGNNSQIARFPLPDNWDVTEVTCVIVPCPNDPQYFEMLRGLLDTLTWQRSFMLHRTENAAYQVSKTWERALNSRELKFSNCGEFDVTDIRRVKPGFPWISQQSTDDGATWHDYQILAHWGDVGSIAPPITSQTDADNLTAAMLKQLWEYIATILRDQIGASVPKADTVANITGQLAPYGAGAAFSDAISHAWDTMNSLSSGDRDLWAEDCQYTGLHDDMRHFANDNPYSWLDQLSAWLLDHLSEWSGTLMHDLNAAAAALGGPAAWNFVANQGGAGGGAGFGDTCTWEHTFDFTTGEQGWAAVGNFISSGPCVTGASGDYVAGEGYRPLFEPLSSPTSDTRYQVYIMITFEATTITEVDMEFTGLGNTVGQAHDDCELLNDANYQTSPHVFDVTDATYSSMCVSLRTDADTQRVTAVTLHGLGINPFA